MMKRNFVWQSMLAATVFGCGANTELDTQTFQIDHLDEQRLAALIEPYVYFDRQVRPGTMAMSGNLLTVRETVDNLGKIARVLEEYDQPQPAVRLHFQVIEANGGSEPEPSIQEIEAQLRQLFRFEGYELVGEAVIGATAGSGVMQEFGPSNAPFEINVNIAAVRGTIDSGSVILDVMFSAFEGGTLSTTVNARAGQTVVLGNAQLRRGSGTLILAVKPELVRM